jgi:hypothetical protein
MHHRGDRLWHAVLAANLVALAYLALRVPRADAAVALVTVVALDIAAFFWQVAEALARVRFGRRAGRSSTPPAGTAEPDGPVVEVRLEGGSTTPD